MKLYAHPSSYQTKKALVAARYVGLELELPKATSKEEVGKIPVLETSHGCVFSAQAIARYVSRLNRVVGLYGQNLIEGGMIDSWLEFSTHELEVPLQALLTPEMAAVHDAAKEDVGKALTILNNHLLHNTYMVGHTFTLADIALSCALVDGMQKVLDAGFRKPFGNLMRWFNLCTAQPEFAAVLGEIKLCGAAGKAAPAGQQDKTAADAKPKADAKAKAEPKGKAKAAEAKKTAPAVVAPAAAGGDVEAAIRDVGDKIRLLKEKLKADGKSGKQVNEDPEIKGLVEQLQALKAQPPAGGAGDGTAKATPKAEAKPKKEEAKKADDKKKGDNKKMGESSPPTAEELAVARKALLKKVIKEGGKRGVEIEGAADMGGLQFFCTSMDLPDGDVELLAESMKAMNVQCDPTEEERKGGSGAIGKMIFSAGTEQLAVVAYVPEAKQGELSCEEWLKKVLSNFNGKVESVAKDVCTGHVKADPDKGVFPLKIRETMILDANNFLRSKGLFPEDNGSSDDEMVFGDDDFPS